MSNKNHILTLIIASKVLQYSSPKSLVIPERVPSGSKMSLAIENVVETTDVSLFLYPTHLNSVKIFHTEASVYSY